MAVCVRLSLEWGKMVLQQEDAFSERRVQRYLERIGVFEELEVNYDSLLMIQAQHMLTVR